MHVSESFHGQLQFFSDCPCDVKKTLTYRTTFARHLNKHFVLLCLEELYGDFEDLETGEVHKGQTGQQDLTEVGLVYME